VVIGSDGLVIGLDYTESVTSDGQHVIKIASLGPKEFFSVEFLSLQQVAGSDCGCGWVGVTGEITG
jgi:hypothetical protein